MPTYQYACTECAERLEVVQRFSDDPLTVCASCGGRLRKVFSPVGIVFKGSGFYRTDSRNGSVPATPNGKAASSEINGSSDGSGGDKAAANGKSEAASSGPSGSGPSGSGSSGSGSSGDGKAGSSNGSSPATSANPAKVA